MNPSGGRPFWHAWLIAASAGVLLASCTTYPGYPAPPDAYENVGAADDFAVGVTRIGDDAWHPQDHKLRSRPSSRRLVVSTHSRGLSSWIAVDGRSTPGLQASHLRTQRRDRPTSTCWRSCAYGYTRPPEMYGSTSSPGPAERHTPTHMGI
jgi:hypothetical protein